MKPMIEVIIAVILISLTMLLSGCLITGSVDPYDHGYAVGTAVYAGYAHVAENKDESFKAAIAELWVKVNALQSTENLATDITELTGAFDKISAVSNLSDADKATIAKLKNMVLSKVDKDLNAEALKHDNAVKFLIGVRAGVNAMIDLSKQ